MLNRAFIFSALSLALLCGTAFAQMPEVTGMAPPPPQNSPQIAEEGTGGLANNVLWACPTEIFLPDNGAANPRANCGGKVSAYLDTCANACITAGGRLTDAGEYTANGTYFPPTVWYDHPQIGECTFMDAICVKGL